jgi:hypothetical protein
LPQPLSCLITLYVLRLAGRYVRPEQNVLLELPSVFYGLLPGVGETACQLAGSLPL